MNTAADNKYRADDLPALVAPLLVCEADMVVGDRSIKEHGEFSFLKRVRGGEEPNVAGRPRVVSEVLPIRFVRRACLPTVQLRGSSAPPGRS
jgi:hypothetical protein